MSTNLNIAAPFRSYIDFYKSTLPESQYRATSARLVNPSGDIEGLVLRDPEDETKMIDLLINPNISGKGDRRAMVLAVKNLAKEKACMRLQWATKHDNPTRRLWDQLASCDFVEYRIKLD